MRRAKAQGHTNVSGCIWEESGGAAQEGNSYGHSVIASFTWYDQDKEVHIQHNSGVEPTRQETIKTIFKDKARVLYVGLRDGPDLIPTQFPAWPDAHLEGIAAYVARRAMKSGTRA